MSPNAGVVRLIVLEIIRPMTMLATIDFQINNFTALPVCVRTRMGKYFLNKVTVS